MKKPTVNLMVLITCVFAAFVGGFATGRSLNRTPVRIWQATVSPTEETEEASAGPTAPAGPTEPLTVNINTATSAQLEALPGIGPALAGRIISYRDANGPFRAREELTKVKGIGEAKLEEIWDLITIGGES